MLRRRRSPRPPHELDEIVAIVERAKEALVAATPSPRGVPGRPVAEALLEFETGLRDARTLLEATMGNASPYAQALDDSLRRAEGLRLEPPALDYETLVTVLADLIAPLDAFGEAESDRRVPRTI